MVKTERNITCPKCRHRHPPTRSCAKAKQLAKIATAKELETVERRSQESTAALWENLNTYIANYTSASIDKSWKGSGDPANFDLIEARLKVAELELLAHITKIKREYLGDESEST